MCFSAVENPVPGLINTLSMRTTERYEDNIRLKILEGVDSSSVRFIIRGVAKY